MGLEEEALRVLRIGDRGGRAQIRGKIERGVGQQGQQADRIGPDPSASPAAIYGPAPDLAGGFLDDVAQGPLRNGERRR